jgi:UDP-N-acetylmuramate dehydrogenase
MDIKEHVSLRDISWFKTGGITEYYVACHTIAEVMEAVKQAQRLNVAYRVIGESSNMLMSDSGFPGLVVQNKSEAMVFLHDRTQVMVDAGAPLHHLVTRTLSHGYSGLEFLAGLPGTIGGAVYGNARAFGFQVSDYVRSATLLFPHSTQTEAIRRVDREWFEFDYATSCLKQHIHDSTQMAPVILSVTLQLCKMNPATCLYRANEYFRLRNSSQPNEAHALHVFDTVRVSGAAFSLDQSTNHKPTLRPHHYAERSQIRQWRRGAMSIYRENPNIIINSGLGTSRDAALLIEQVQNELSVEGNPLVSTIDYMGLWD